MAIIYFVGSFFLRSLSGTSSRYYSGKSFEAPSSISNSLKAPSLSLDFGKNEKAESGAGQQQEGALTQRKIIKNGEISLFVKDILKSAEEISYISTISGGYVQNSSIGETSSGGIKSGTIIIRIPALKFEEVFGKIKFLAVNVERESISVTDVGEQYQDLEAQLRNLEAAEAQYQKIMERAFTINDILQVSQKLSDARGQIEKIKGQIQYLDRQIDISTIKIYLTSESEVKIFGIKWTPLLNIKKTFRSMLAALAGFIDFIVKIIIYLPVIILVAAFIFVVFSIFRKLYYWGKNKFFDQKGITQ